MTASAPRDNDISVPALNVKTTAIADLGPLAPMLQPGNPLVWMRRGFGLVGYGEVLRMEFHGTNRMREAANYWQRVVAAATVTDELRQTGTGLLAFGAFTFADTSATSSVLIVPSIIIGRDLGASWITQVSVGALASAEPPAGVLPENALPTAVPFGSEFQVDLQPGSVSAAHYRDLVATAVRRIRDGRLSKAVLARELLGWLPPGADIRRTIATLAVGYPDCWTFAVDGFIGSSPETLISVKAGAVTARVLAGSAARGLNAASDEEAAIALAASAKDQDEHRFAVQDVLASLRPHSPCVLASEIPFTLKLPNLWHLASDLEGRLTDGSTSLDLIDSLHPTAAVAGTPTNAALDLIAELEPFDRGRYAGPVGWVGADGDGEWAVALRSAQLLPGGQITAYAGAGIVAESVPEWELLETRMKFRPIVEALA